MSPGATCVPAVATMPLTITRPDPIMISISRREPIPDCAMTLCKRSRLTLALAASASANWPDFDSSPLRRISAACVGECVCCLNESATGARKGVFLPVRFLRGLPRGAPAALPPKPPSNGAAPNGVPNPGALPVPPLTPPRPERPPRPRRALPVPPPAVLPTALPTSPAMKLPSAGARPLPWPVP